MLPLIKMQESFVISIKNIKKKFFCFSLNPFKISFFLTVHFLEGIIAANAFNTLQSVHFWFFQQKSLFPSDIVNGFHWLLKIPSFVRLVIALLIFHPQYVHCLFFLHSSQRSCSWTGKGHLRKPPGVELIPCHRKPLRRMRTLRDPAQTQVWSKQVWLDITFISKIVG